MHFPITGATLLCLLLPNLAWADAPDPLRLVPGAADAIARVETGALGATIHASIDGRARRRPSCDCVRATPSKAETSPTRGGRPR